MNPTPEQCAKGGRSLSPAKLAALAAAREKRKIAAARTAPEGWRSPDHLLIDTREFCAGHHLHSSSGLTALARYLGASESHTRRWLSLEKMPMQPTLELIAQWRRNRAVGV